MTTILEKVNSIALDITKKYQNIKYGEISVSVPYFINTAEQEYKKAMHTAGVEEELLEK